MSDRTHALLVAARAERPSDDDRARVRAALAASLVGVAATATAAAVTGAPPASASTGTATSLVGAVAAHATKLTVLALVVGASTLSLLAAQAPLRPTTASTIEAPPAQRAVTSVAPVASIAPFASPAAATDSAHAREAPAPQSTARSASVHVTGARPPSPSMTDALAGLRRADEAIRAGDDARALSLLAPLAGIAALSEEVSALTAVARCGAHRAGARASGRAFVTEHANSVYVTRVKTKCGLE